MEIENDFKCSCPPEFTGKRCEVNIDECINSPCVNGVCEYRFIKLNRLSNPITEIDMHFYLLTFIASVFNKT
jgi:hypothetical protein